MHVRRNISASQYYKQERVWMDGTVSRFLLSVKITILVFDLKITEYAQEISPSQV